MNLSAEEIADRTDELLFSLRLTSIARRECGGTWVGGTCGPFQFHALVFRDGKPGANFMLGDRISKLWLEAMGKVAYEWDRGSVAVVNATSDDALLVVDLMAGGLACLVFGPDKEGS